MQYHPPLKRLEGRHAFLAPSNFYWIRYSDERLAARYKTHTLAARGSALHALAHDLIKLGVKLRDDNTTLSSFVNHVIGFKMESELQLVYSDNCFGTADALGFRKNVLRIFDLKTGTTPAHVEQLMVYAALFCLEYEVDPFEIDIELRIYQNDEILVWSTTPNADEGDLELDPVDIRFIMQKIKDNDKLIEEWRAEEED